MLAWVPTLDVQGLYLVVLSIFSIEDQMLTILSCELLSFLVMWHAILPLQWGVGSFSWNFALVYSRIHFVCELKLQDLRHRWFFIQIFFWGIPPIMEYGFPHKIATLVMMSISQEEGRREKSQTQSIGHVKLHYEKKTWIQEKNTHFQPLYNNPLTRSPKNLTKLSKNSKETL